MKKEDIVKKIEAAEKELAELKVKLNEPERKFEDEEDVFFIQSDYSEGIEIDEFIYSHSDGEIAEIEKIGFIFKTEKEAGDHLLRLESMANAYKPKEGEEIYLYDIGEKCAIFQRYIPNGVYSNTKNHRLCQFIGAFHKTPAEAKEWGKKYAAAFEYLFK